MADDIDPETGEVRDEEPGEVSPESEKAVLELMTPRELVSYVPLTPDQIEEAIFQIAGHLEQAAKAIVVLYEERHRAEEKYQKAFSKAVIRSPYNQVTMARQYAVFHTEDELHELNLAKEKLRYAEEMKQSLQSKHYALMNINKTVAAMYNMPGARRG